MTPPIPVRDKDGNYICNRCGGTFTPAEFDDHISRRLARSLYERGWRTPWVVSVAGREEDR